MGTLWPRFLHRCWNAWAHFWPRSAFERQEQSLHYRNRKCLRLQTRLVNRQARIEHLRDRLQARQRRVQFQLERVQRLYPVASQEAVWQEAMTLDQMRQKCNRLQERLDRQEQAYQLELNQMKDHT